MSIASRAWQRELVERFGEQGLSLFLKGKGVFLFKLPDSAAKDAETNSRAAQLLRHCDGLISSAGKLTASSQTVKGEALVLSRLEKARHLINLLRPELVRALNKPLSSDAFTFFGAHDAAIHNAEAAAGESLPHRFT